MVLALAEQRNVWIFTNSGRKRGNKRLLRKIVNTGGVTGEPAIVQTLYSEQHNILIHNYSIVENVFLQVGVSMVVQHSEIVKFFPV